MKKTLTILLGAMLIVANLKASYESGFYFGINAGGSYDYNKVDEDNTRPINRGKKLNGCALQEGVFLGYLYRFQESMMAMGVEHSSNISSYSKSWNSVDQSGSIYYNNKLIRNYTGSFVGKFGTILKDEWFLYGLLGVEVSCFKYDLTIFRDGTGAAPEGAKTSKTLLGLCYGIGFEREIQEHWRLGFEVKNIHYRSKEMTASTAIGHDKLKPKLNTVYAGLRLSYAF